MCGDSHGTASCGAGNVCSLTCQSGYNLCGGRCVATTATAVCKGQCATATCSWSPHTGTVAVAFIDVDVDAAGVTHAASTNQRALAYYQIAGAGPPMTEGVGNTTSCWGFSVSGSQLDAPPLVRGDGSGKARIMCPSGNVLNSLTWAASAWKTTRVHSTSTSQDAVEMLVGAGDRIAFFIRPYLATPDTSFNFAELKNNAWTITQSIAIGQAVYDYFLGGAPGAAKVAWVPPNDTSKLNVLTQNGSTFSAQVVTRPAATATYGIDARGNLIAAGGDLKLYTYASGVWTNETITTGSSTSYDLVVDAFGVIRVAWLDTTGGSHLATKIGTTWSVEQVSTTPARTIELAVGPTGKVAIGIITSASPSVLTVFD